MAYKCTCIVMVLVYCAVLCTFPPIKMLLVVTVYHFTGVFIYLSQYIYRQSKSSYTFGAHESITDSADRVSCVADLFHKLLY